MNTLSELCLQDPLPTDLIIAMGEESKYINGMVEAGMIPDPEQTRRHERYIKGLQALRSTLSEPLLTQAIDLIRQQYPEYDTDEYGRLWQ